MSDGKRDYRYYTLDFWRGVACLMVVVFHSSYYLTENPVYTKSQGFGRLVSLLLGHLWVGVPVFFVISGYCITAACESSRRKGLNLLQYFKRRARRIYPPFWVALLLLFGLCGLLVVLGQDGLLYDSVHPSHRPSSLLWTQWVGNISLTETWRHTFGGGPPRFFLGVTWTLCYEEQFYAICGLLLLLSGRFYFGACVALSALVVPLAVLCWHLEGGKPIGFFFDGRWLEFACGIAVYYRVQCMRPRNLFARWRVFELSLFLIAVGIFFFWKQNPIQLLEELFVSAGFAAMIIVLFPRDRRIFGGLAWRGVWVSGSMCYSLYLVHAPVVKCTSQILYQAGVQGALATLVISIPLSVAVACGVGWCFHCLVERRFLNTDPVELRTVFVGPTRPCPKAINAGSPAGSSVSGLTAETGVTTP